VAASLASDRDPENITRAIFPRSPNGRLGSRARHRPSSKDLTLTRRDLAFTARGSVSAGREVGAGAEQLLQVTDQRRRFNGRIRGNNLRVSSPAVMARIDKFNVPTNCRRD